MAPIYTFGLGPHGASHRGYELYDAHTSKHLRRLTVADIEDEAEELLGRKVTPQEFHALSLEYGSFIPATSFLRS
jgi:hypothetical protein